jgi:hypothetical protein
VEGQGHGDLFEMEYNPRKSLISFNQQGDDHRASTDVNPSLSQTPHEDQVEDENLAKMLSSAMSL